MLRNTVFFGFAFLFLIPFTFPSITEGHAVGFKSLTTVTEEGYEVDFGYEENTLREQTQTRLSFELYDNQSTTTLSSFTEVWVVIKGSEGTVFSGGIDRPEFGDTSISFMFPEEGEYDVQLRYQEDSEILAKGNFALQVPMREDKQVNTNAYLASGALIGLIVGFLTALLIRRKRL